MKISAKIKAIYRERRKEHAKRIPTAPDYTRRKIAWSPIRTKDELNALYRRILPEIRRVAYASGYGLGVHGSMRRDLDLIAVPWTDEAVNKNLLADRIQLSICGMKESKRTWEEKPHGRTGTIIVVAMNAFIDLSVTPRTTK